MVKGYSDMESGSSFFSLELRSAEEALVAAEMASLSAQVVAIQEQGRGSQAGEDTLVAGELPGSAPIKICLAVPITSKKTDMQTVRDSPFWSNIMDSFMKSIDWRSNKFYFTFYVGFDKADELYDTGDAWSEFRDEFHKRAAFRMSEQLMEPDEIEFLVKKRLGLRIMHFEHLDGAPSQIVSQLVSAAYVDNHDYFYQVNDDTWIETANWPEKLVGCLSSSLIPNFGVTGPLDSNNDKIFTHSFTHRTHLEVFGYLFPPAFKNWWSDDWYASLNTAILLVIM